MIKDICDLLVGKDNEDDLRRYARGVALYGLASVLNSTRCSIVIPNDIKDMPINLYGIFLGSSGIGKTKSVNFVNELILEATKRIKAKVEAKLEIMDPFGMQEITDLTKDGITIADSYKSLTDSATLKLMRVMDITDYYSINYIVDEFASVVMREYEMLSSTIIEIYDKGKVPVNLRATSKTAKCDNPVPLNMLAFGSSHLLFESDSNIEKAFLDLLQAGLARRTLFVNAKTSVNKFTLNANDHRSTIDSIIDKFVKLQDKYDHYKLQLTDDAIKLYNDYMESNTEDSINISDFQMLNKIYAKNRSWLALKISGLIACSKFENEVTKESYQEAIDIVEDSYSDFKSIINRPQKYEIIVDWLLDTGNSENEYTLTQALPFYKDIKNKKNFWDLAKGFAYENNITLMIEDRRNITFYQAKAKKKTNLEEPLLFSYSMDMAKDYYTNDDIAWKDLYKVVQKNGLCYSAHTFKEGYRLKDNAIEGFDLIMLDVDGGTPLDIAKLLLDNYTYLISTTRSHNKEKNGIVCDRYRIILPMKNRLELDKDQYTKFMTSLMEDMPIELDTCTVDISRMFFGSEGEYWYNEGILFDADKYIPNTQEEEQYKKQGSALAKKNIGGISQYIIRNESNGRNNQLIKLAMLLTEKGYSHEEAKEEILRVNKQFNNPLSEAELQRTIFKSLARREVVEVEEYEEDDEFAIV